MLPTLGGRIQTRIFLLATVGVLVTLIIVPLLPADGAPLGTKYKVAFIVLATVAVLGVAWECVYHFLMQWRWEKDWPTFLALDDLPQRGHPRLPARARTGRSPASTDRSRFCSSGSTSSPCGSWCGWWRADRCGCRSCAGGSSAGGSCE